jgi:hypothetical protein
MGGSSFYVNCELRVIIITDKKADGAHLQVDLRHPVTVRALINNLSTAFVAAPI